LVPHDDVETVPALEELDVADDAADEADVLVDAELLPVELELELQAARTPSDSAATTAAAARVRQWTDLFMSSAFSWLTGSSFSLPNGSGAPPGGAAPLPGASRKKTPFTGSTSKRCFFALL